MHYSRCVNLRPTLRFGHLLNEEDLAYEHTILTIKHIRNVYHGTIIWWHDDIMVLDYDNKDMGKQ